MRKKFRLFALMCMAAISILAFVACVPGQGQTGDGSQGGDNPGAECEHPMSEEWSTNPTHHWHAATCEHGEHRGDYAIHADKDEDGFCDSCAFELGHEHSFSSQWSFDLENHWKVATCTHTEKSIGFEYHYDNNYDGECDVCTAHVHVVNSYGRCDICDLQVKPVDTSALSDIITAVGGGYSNINGGKITYAFNGRGAAGGSTNSSKIIEYILGASGSYFKTSSANRIDSTDKEGASYEADLSDVVEKWYELLPDKSVFGVYRDTRNGTVGELMIDGTANANVFGGYYYSVSTLASGYGAENILYELYMRSQETSASEFLVAHDEETNSYKFLFNYTAVNKMPTTVGIVTNVNYFVVSVEFSYNDNYSLTSMSIICDCYTNDAGANLEGEADTANVDLDYDTATGIVTLRENAVADRYTFEVEQYVGEKTYVSEYPKDYFTPKGFEVYSDSGFTTLHEGEIEATQGGFVYFYLKEAGENGNTFAAVDTPPTCTLVNNENGTNDGISPLFNPISSRIMFYAKYAGVYTVTIQHKDTVKTFTVTITEQA